MKLDKTQIKRVKDFVSGRGFTFYDVQLEIIDHVACKVEDLMTANPALTLDAAIAQTHAGFGVMGFSVVEDAMRVSLQKRYRRLFWGAFLSYFKLIYIPLQAGFIYLVYMLAKTINSTDAMVDMAWGTAFLLIGAYVLTNYRHMRKYRRMLTMQMGGIAIMLINLPMQLLTWLPNLSPGIFNNGVTAVISGFLLTLIIIVFLALQQIQKIALSNCRELNEQYQLTVSD